MSMVSGLKSGHLTCEYSWKRGITNQYVHYYYMKTGYLPNKMIWKGKVVKYKGRAPWLAAYWQWLYSGGAKEENNG